MIIKYASIFNDDKQAGHNPNSYLKKFTHIK